MTFSRNRRRGAARSVAWVAFLALAVSACVPYTTAYKPDPTARKTYLKVDPAVPAAEEAFLLSFEKLPTAAAPAGPLVAKGSRKVTGPALKVTKEVEQRYKDYWTPAIIPLGILVVAEAPAAVLLSPIVDYGKQDNEFRMLGGWNEKRCQINGFILGGFHFLVGHVPTCETVGEPRVTEKAEPAGMTITEEHPLAELPLKVRLLADGAPLPGGKGSRNVATDAEGRATLPLQPLLSELPDSVRAVEVELSAEGGKAAPAKAPLDGALVEALLGPVREERLADEAARDGKGIVALDRYAKVLALRKETAGSETFRKLASTYRALPVKPAVPEDVRRLVVQAEALAKENEAGKATGKLDEAIGKAPWLPAAWYDRAFARAMEKDYGGAIRSMETYLLLAPDAPDARKAKDQVYQWETFVPAAAAGSADGGGLGDDSPRGQARGEKVRSLRQRGR